MATQLRNDDQVDLLDPDFVGRSEPNYSFKSVCSIFQALPGLRGFWPMSAFGATGQAFDQSGNARTLTYNGNPIYSQENLIPYIRFDGTGDFLSRADEAGLDIIGTETYVNSSYQGVTIGAWIYPENLTDEMWILGKYGVVVNRAYLLQFRGDVANDPARFIISDDGVNFDLVDSSASYNASTWNFSVGRYNDSLTGEELAVFLNGTKTTAATARNSIFNNAIDFTIGASSLAGAPMTGRVSMCFLCAQAVSDSIISALFHNTRAMFDV